MIKYIDEYRDKATVEKIAKEIKRISAKPASLMEVCGGHTMAIQKFGIPSLLPQNIKLLSGPGCPVCVTDRKYIDQAIAYSRLSDAIIATFGDLIRVPGSTTSLEKEKAKGANIKILYSALDAIKLAKQYPNKKIIFLGIGFETTAPGSAATIMEASRQNLSNFYLYSAHKLMPPAMEALIDEGVKISGYISPGHVSTITGSGIYDNIPKKYGLPVVIAGFEPIDLMLSIYMLVKQIEEDKPKVEIQYKRAVQSGGNKKAMEIMRDVFAPRDDWWRGLGILKDSGMGIRDNYSGFDAEKRIEVEVEPTREDKACICGLILKGLNSPKDCKLFAKACTPTNPVGACMVSNEGACAAHFRYSLDKINDDNL